MRFFHACANARRKSNRISIITDAAGVQYTSTEEVQMVFVNYFSDLFTFDDAGDMEPCLQNLDIWVSDEMNVALLKLFVMEEIQMALTQMAPLKAPGPDGFPAGFYQSNWSTVGDAIC